MPVNNAVTRWVARRAIGWAVKTMVKREPDFVIGDRLDPYLERWWIIPRNPAFNVYLHAFHRSDDDRALHDHPFASVSLALRGEMRERWLRKVRMSEMDRGMRKGFVWHEDERDVRSGDVIFRRAKFAHRMIVEPGSAGITLFITGPRTREWGFHCPKGWVVWKQFVDARDNGKVGRGCD